MTLKSCVNLFPLCPLKKSNAVHWCKIMGNIKGSKIEVDAEINSDISLMLLLSIIIMMMTILLIVLLLLLLLLLPLTKVIIIVIVLIIMQ